MYTKIPFIKNQDFIRIKKGKGDLNCIAAIVDGFNELDYFDDYEPGKEIAKYVAKNFPPKFLDSFNDDIQAKAEQTAEIIDQESLKIFPSGAACVAAFLFDYENHDLVVVIGSVFVFIYSNGRWKKLKGVGDYSIDPKKYGADVSRFFGLGNLKKNKMFNTQADVVIVSPKRPLIIATDGIKGLLSLDAINKTTTRHTLKRPHYILEELAGIIKERKKRQKDDVAIFLKYK